jgi:hypothetical protein
MAVGTQSTQAVDPDVEPREQPEVSVCESCPGKVVFIERGNTEGWMASDSLVDVTR